MLKDLFDAVTGAAQQALRPAVILAGPEPPHVYLLAKPSGEVQRQEAAPAPRGHTAQDLATIAAWALDAAAAARVAVWYSRQGIVALLDDSTRRDRVSLPLELSPQIELLSDLKGSMTQKEFVALLRVQLAGCGAEVASLLKASRNLKISTQANAEGRVNHGVQSVTKGMVAAAVNATDYPEECAVQAPVFTSVNTDPEAVHCAVDLDPTDPRPLALLPLPGEIENAIQRAEEVLRARLASLLFGATEKPNVSLSYGRP